MGPGDAASPKGPPPAVGATLIAAAALVLVLGMAWLARDDVPDDRLVAPTADGVTMPTDGTGEPIALPPSQPATPVSFGPDGTVVRPDPVRARVIDESGDEVLVPLLPNATVDTVTGEIVTTTGTTRPTGTTGTTNGTTSTTSTPPSSDPPTTTTTDPPTTEPPTTEPTDPGGLGGLVDAVLP